MLKVWLPLTKETNNQGVSGTKFTNTGATLSTGYGPIGNSFLFDGTNDQIEGTYPCHEAEYTACMWVNFSKINVHLLDMRSKTGETGYQPMYVGSSGVQVGGSNSSYVYINFVPSLDTWYHLCVTADSTKTSLYVNGEYYNSTTSAKATNFNKDMEVHLGSRCSGANWFGGRVADFRIYNTCLTANEVKAIVRSPILHYKYWTSGQSTVIDSSGFNRNATIVGTITSETGENPGRYGKAIGVGSSENNYFYVTSPSSMTKSISFWLKTPKTASTVCFADYKSKMAFGLNGSGYIIANCDTLNVKMYDAASLIANKFNHIVIVKNEADTDVDLYINGTQVTTRYSNNYWTHSSDTLMFGRRSTGTPMSCSVSDIRVYSVRLTSDEILDLYHTPLKLMQDGTNQTFELIENTVNKVQITQNGQLINNEFVESTSGNEFKSTQVISNEFIER